MKLNNLIDIMREEKVVVNCNTEEKAMKLLKELDKYNVKWFFGERASTCTYWDREKEDTCYCIDDNVLFYGNIDTYIYFRYRIIGFEDE